jgi:hypothetical protein
MGNSDTKVLDDYWANDPTKIIEMYSDDKSRDLAPPSHKAWLEEKSAQIEQLKSKLATPVDLSESDFVMV